MGLLWKSGFYLARWGCDKSNVRLSHTFSDTLRIWRKNMRNVASKMSFHRDFAYGDQPFSQSSHILGPTKPRDTCNPRGTWKKQGLLKQALLWIPLSGNSSSAASAFGQGAMVHGKLVVDIHGFIKSFLMHSWNQQKRQTGQTQWLPRNRYPMVSIPGKTGDHPSVGTQNLAQLLCHGRHCSWPCRASQTCRSYSFSTFNIAIRKIIKCFIGKSSDLMVM